MRKEDMKNIPSFLLGDAAERLCDKCGQVCLYTPSQYTVAIDHWWCKPCAAKESPEVRSQEFTEAMKQKLREQGINPDEIEKLVTNAPLREW